MAPNRRLADLPEELLEYIFKRPTMDMIDLLHCRDVCLSWYSIINKLTCKKLVPLLPPLLFFPEEKDGNLNSFCTNDIEFYRLCVPATHTEGVCMYSYRGWLLLKVGCCDIQLYNPLTMVKFKLPRPQEKCLPFKFIMSANPSDTQNCIILMLDCTREKFLLCRLGDTHWSQIMHAQNPCEDMIHYNGKFYAIEDHGNLIKFEFGNFYCNVKASSSKPSHARCNRRYLVESPCGDLLMVVRYKYFEFREANNSDVMTKLFEVFRLDWDKEEWQEVKSFEDHALFLAHNDSKFVFARDSTIYKHNCIYFLDDSREGYSSRNFNDFGVFDMGNRTIDQFCSIPFNRWFRPDI